MLTYTLGTLKSHLQTWAEGNGVDADEDFVAALDEIIQRGEVKLYNDLDLTNLDGDNSTITTELSADVFKPDNLINEGSLFIATNTAAGTLPMAKRSLAYVRAVNRQDATGVPRFYAEFDEDRWIVAPVADAGYMIFVHGNYTPASITDGGDDNNTTWLSTRMAKVLSDACRVQAADMLKFWNLKAQSEVEYQSSLDDVRGITSNLRRVDIEDLIAGGASVNQPTVPPNPAAT